MKGEFDSPSKAATDEYRANWERIYQPVNRQMQDWSKTPEISVLSGNNQHQNGCPLLDENR